jgi:hypothetical protein
MSLLDDEDILISNDEILNNIPPKKEYYFEYVLAWKDIFYNAVEQYENGLVDHMYLARLVKKLKDNYWPYFIRLKYYYSPNDEQLNINDLIEIAEFTGIKYHNSLLYKYMGNCLMGNHMDNFSLRNFNTLMSGLIYAYRDVIYCIQNYPNIIKIDTERVDLYKAWIKK